MNKKHSTPTFKGFRNCNVLVIGDIMVDSYLWGDVTRISPEGPIPVVSVTNREHRLGGAANVALNLKALGANPIIASVAGDDTTGKIFLDLLFSNDLSSDYIILQSDRITTKKSRIISNNQHLLRVDEETEEYLSQESAGKFISRVEACFEEHEIAAVIFQDYDKGVLSKEIIDRVTSIANSRNIPTLVDPKVKNYSQYHNVSLFKPNFKEFCRGAGVSLKKDNKEEILQQARKLISDQNIGYLLLTLSEAGILICNKDDYHFIPAEVRDIADVSGAGDTVISVACMCLVSGLSAEETARISNIAGGLVCEKVGVVPIDPQELASELS